MPFDGSGFTQNCALQKIDAVIDLLASEGRWCKGALRTQDGRYCLKGALQAVDAELLLEPVVLQAIGEVTDRSCWRIESFNDRRTTTHAVVLRVLERARERIVLGEAAPPPRETAMTLAVNRLRGLAGRMFHLGAQA